MLKIYNRSSNIITIDDIKIRAHSSADFDSIKDVSKYNRLSSLGIISVSQIIDNKENKTKHSSKGSKKNQANTINSIIDNTDSIIDGEISIDTQDIDIGDDA